MSDNISRTRNNNKNQLLTRTGCSQGYKYLNADPTKGKCDSRNVQSVYGNFTLVRGQFIIRDETPGYEELYYIFNSVEQFDQVFPYNGINRCSEVIPFDRRHHPKFDLDDCKSLEDSQDIIEAIELTLGYFGRVSTAVCSSSGIDNITGAQVYSYHIIVTNRAYENAAVAKYYADKIKLLLTDAQKKCFDDGLNNGATHNLRTPLSVKNGRVKQVPAGFTRAQVMVCGGLGINSSAFDDVDTNTIYANTIIAQAVITHEELITNADSELIVNAAATHLHGWRYRDTVGNLIRFWRQKNVADPNCPCCNDKHTNDNSRVLIVRKRGIYLACFKNKLKNAIFIVPSYDIPNFTDNVGNNITKKAGTIVIKPKRVNRKKTATDIINEHLPIVVPVIDIATQFKFTNHETYDEPIMREYPDAPKTIYIRAPMKIGKTVNLIKLLPRSARIVIISARRTYTHEIMNTLSKLGLGFVSYQDITGDIDLIKYPRIIIQVQSLHRLLHNVAPDLLVLDESEAVFGEFTSDTMSVKSAEFCVKKMEGLLTRAIKVIALDANLGHTTIDLIRKARGSDSEFLVQNTHKNMINDRVHIMFKKACLIDAIIAAIKAGINIIIPTNSLAFAKLVRELIAKIIPSEQILSLTSETSDAEKADIFADVNGHWVRYRVVIYTPTCGAGISFTCKHFNKVFGYFTTSSTCVESWCQALYRARDISTNEYYICIKADGAPNIPNIEAMKATIRLKNQVYSTLAPAMRYDLIDNGEGKYIRTWTEDFHFELYAHVKLVENQSHSRAISHFIELCMIKGATIIPYETAAKLDTNDMIRDTNLIIKAADYERIIAAPELTHDRLIELNDAKIKQTIDDKLALNRLNLRNIYNWRGPITSDFMKTYADKKVIEVTNNLRASLKYDCMHKSIDEIRLQEIKDNPDRSVRSNRYIRLKIASDIITRMGFSHFCDRSDKPKCEINTYLEIIWNHLEFSSKLIADAFPTKAKIKNWNYTNGLKYINGILDTVFGCKIVNKGHSDNKIVHIKHKIYGTIIAQEAVDDRPYIIRGWTPAKASIITDNIIDQECGLNM